MASIDARVNVIFRSFIVHISNVYIYIGDKGPGINYKTYIL